MNNDEISVTWDADVLHRQGVESIRLVAQPIDKSLTTLECQADASRGEATMSSNVAPSTKYSIHVEDAEGAGFHYSSGEVEI